MALPYMPSQRTSSGLGRSISTRISRSASSDSGDPRQGPRERPAVEGIDADDGRVADLGQDDVAVGDQDDDAHQVGPLDRQERLLSALGGRADQGPRVERPVGHDPVERRDDLGVFQVDLQPVQAAPRPRPGPPWPRRRRPSPDRPRPRRPGASPWPSGRRSRTGPLGGDGRRRGRSAARRPAAGRPRLLRRPDR